jgi:sec-independent protein translocase protein TatB
MRRVSNHFRTGIETMIREAELEEMEKKWREQNEAIMQAHPPGSTTVTPALIEHAPAAMPETAPQIAPGADHQPGEAPHLPPVLPVASAE